MQSFKITKEELETFARKLYSEACCGYLDLCEAVTDKMVTDFLDGRTPVFSGLLDGFPPSNTISPGVTIAPFVTGAPFSSGYSTAGSYSTAGTFTIGADPAARPGFPNDTQLNGNNPYPASLETAGYHGHSGPAYEAAMTGGDNAFTTPPSLFDGVDFSPENSPDNSVVVTESPVIREEAFVRIENFAGNESERF